MTGNTLRNGRYVLKDPLGEGGMATVWRAWDQRLQVWRAIKILSPQLATKAKILSRFETEARTMASLDHEHIVRVIDVDQDGDRSFIVMELVEGGNLVDWLDRHGVMPARMAAGVVIEVCQALAYAHERGVVHRDIKPHNVMIDRKGICRLTDFGIARAGDDDQGLTRTGAVMGTWGYMAPEQRSDAKHVDLRADIYATGATLFSLVTNRVPSDLFAADQDPTLMAGVDPELVPVIRRCCEYRREGRFASAQELVVALLAVLERLPELPVETPPLALDVSPQRSPPSESPANETIIVPEEGAAPVTMSLPRVEVAITPPGGPSPRSGRAPEAAAEVGSAPGGPPPPRRHSWLIPASATAALIGLGVWLSGLNAPIVEAPSGQAVTLPAPCPPGTLRDATTGACLAPPAERPPSCPEGQALDASTGKCVALVTCGPGTRLDPGSGVCVAEKNPQPPPAQPCGRGTRWDGKACVAEPVAGQAAPAPPPPADRQCLNDVVGPDRVSAGATATFRARACKEGKVVLHYRATGGTWYTREMVSRLGQRVALVEIGAELAGGVEWYVTADGASAGSSSAPRRAPGG